MGINYGILFNATPLTRERILQLEEEVLMKKKSFVYLDEGGQLCFSMPKEGLVEGLKELAWGHVYEIYPGDNMTTKTAYCKTGVTTYKVESAEATVISYTEEANELGTTMII